MEGLRYIESLNNGLFGYLNNPTSIIASFDLDWTLIRPTKSKFSKNVDDYAFLPNVISTLLKYQEENYSIVIFTNQKAGGKKLQTILARIENIIDDLQTNGINPTVFIASKENEYRKPNTGMFDYLNRMVNVDKENSFYCGDAGLRPEDFSSSDYDFAKNIGLPFYYPNEIFPNNTFNIPDTQTMIIFVGMQGAGKSTFFENNLRDKGYVHINQDIMKTKTKVLSETEKALKAGLSVAIDRTNPSVESRKIFLNLAVKYNVPAMIIRFVSDGYGRNKLREKPVPDIAYNNYYKNLEEPNEDVDGVPVVEIYT